MATLHTSKSSNDLLYDANGMTLPTVVKNAIILIDKVNQLREEGVPKQQALIEGARSRLRPIIMTSIAAVLLNAWFGKKLLKNNTLLLKVAGNDLLNQNTGFQRTVNSNFITQNTYSTIKRYFMFSVVWNFAKAGTPVPNQQD